jgi:arylsulfatase A-like enzyme
MPVVQSGYNKKEMMKTTMRHNIAKAVGLGTAAFAFPMFGNATAPAVQPLEKSPSHRPNIIFILADDLGVETLGCYGGETYVGLGPVRTPNLDAMAANGMLFKYCFATPVCSPSRAQLLTGKYNFRSGFIDITGRNHAATSLDAQAHPTIAMRLKAAGYVTAVAGKWHLGEPEDMTVPLAPTAADTDYPHPRACGFDRQCMFSGAHLELYGNPTPEEYTPARLQDWVLRFLESRKDQFQPFFLYYPSPIPHKPLYATPLNPDGPDRDQQNFPYLMEYLDGQVGEILNKLKELGLSENTLVFFAGDNGTQDITTCMRNGKSVRGGKILMLDTGSWVPLLACWPGVIKAGSVNEGLVDFTDILPTCLELAGAPVPNGIDGISFAPQLKGRPGKPREWVHTLLVNRYFVRDTKWKLRENGELYDVSNSPYTETLVTPERTSPEAAAARVRLQDIMDQLHPPK